MNTLCYITCSGCGFENAIVFHESRYNGLRGFCAKCEVNWPES